MGSHVAKFRDNSVHGALLVELGEPELAALGFNAFEQKRVSVALRALLQTGYAVAAPQPAVSADASVATASHV